MSAGMFLKLMCNDPEVRHVIRTKGSNEIVKIKWVSSDRVEYCDAKDGVKVIGQEYERENGYPYLEFREHYNYSPFLKLYLQPDRTIYFYSYGEFLRETYLSQSDFRPIHELAELKTNPPKVAVPPKDPPKKNPPKTDPPETPPEIPPQTPPEGEIGDIFSIGYLLGIGLVIGILYWLFSVPLAWVYSHKMDIYAVSRWLLMCLPVPVGIGVAVYQTRKFPMPSFAGFRIGHILLTAVSMAVHTVLLYLVLYYNETDSSNMVGAYLFWGSCVSALVYAIPSAIFLGANRTNKFYGNYWNACARIMNFLEVFVLFTAFWAQTVGHYCLNYNRGSESALMMLLSMAAYFGMAYAGNWINARPYKLVEKIRNKR